MNTKKWTMKTGQKIRIKDMSDSHLLNTIKLIEKKHEELRKLILCNPPCFNGEMAQHYAEVEWDSWDRGEHDDPAETHPLYDELVAELEKRESMTAQAHLGEGEGK